MPDTSNRDSDGVDGLRQRVADLKAHEATQIEWLCKDTDKKGLARIIVAGRIAHAERDVVEAELCEALTDLLTAIDAAAAVKRGDFYHERKAARAALAKARGL